MISPIRRRELRQFAEAYAFDAGQLNIGAPLDALLALLIKAENRAERDYLYRCFWRRYFPHCDRRLKAGARALLREATP